MVLMHPLLKAVHIISVDVRASAGMEMFDGKWKEEFINNIQSAVYS